MSLDARSRSSIYERLVPLIGEQDANALMSEFPSVEGDEPATKDFVRAELAELKGELRTEMASMGGEPRSERPTVQGDDWVREETSRADLAKAIRQQRLWLGGELAGATALVIAAIPLLS